MFKELRFLKPTIRFGKMWAKPINVDIWTFQDSSFNIVSGRDYGKTVIVTGIKAHGNVEQDTFHLVHWKSPKQRRIRHSSYRAGILAISDTDDTGHYLKQELNCMTDEQTVINILHVDFSGLFCTISTLHVLKVYRLRQTIQIISRIGISSKPEPSIYLDGCARGRCCWRFNEEMPLSRHMCMYRRR